MANEKLTKSLKTVHTIVKIMKVLCIIALVFMVILTLALPSFGDIVIQIIEMSMAESGEYVDPAVMTEFSALKDDFVNIFIAAGVTSIVSLVITLMYTKKGEKLVKRMREESVFAEGYGQELRNIGKLMIIEFFASMILMIVLVVVLAPEFASSSLSFNVNLLITASFVYLASYLMDHAYESSKKDESPEEAHVVYVEPMIGDGSEN